MTLLMIPQVRTTIEEWVMIFYVSLVWSRHNKKVAVFFKWVWQALYINCGGLFFS